MNWNYLASEPVLPIVAFIVGVCVLVIVGLIVWVVFRPRMTKGIVCAKEFVPDHNEWNYIPMTDLAENWGITAPFINYISYSKGWFVAIEGRFHGRKRKEIYSVTKEFYDRVQIGSFVDFDKENQF